MMNRIAQAAGLLVALAALACAAAADKKTDKETKEVPPVLDHTMKSLDGEEVDLSKYQGKVLLVVNVASQCGYTPQYEGLQKLHETYADQGLAVLGFPCNQFGAQEPGSAAEIQEFCTENYGVTFDLFEKIEVNGEDQAPLYAHLTSKETDPEHAGPVKWNFEKFLIGRDGKILGRFRSGVKPESEELTKAIEAALAEKPEKK